MWIYFNVLLFYWYDLVLWTYSSIIDQILIVILKPRESWSLKYIGTSKNSWVGLTNWTCYPLIFRLVIQTLLMLGKWVGLTNWTCYPLIFRLVIQTLFMLGKSERSHKNTYLKLFHTDSNITCWENSWGKTLGDLTIMRTEPNPYKRMTPPSTKNLKSLCLRVFFLICYSTFSFLPNVKLRLTLEYLTTYNIEH